MTAEQRAANSGQSHAREFVFRVTLQIEQRRQVAMVDAGVGGFGDDGFGVEGDAEARCLDHAEIVRAIADGHGFMGLQAQFVAQLQQRLDFCLASEDRFSDPAGELAVGDGQFVGLIGVEADCMGDTLGEEGEAARDEGAGVAMFAHGVDEHATARCFGDAIAIDALQRFDSEALQQAHALAQGGLEGDLAAHGAFGDCGDLRFETKFGGEFVDTFLLDDGRIHVGDEEFLATTFGGLDGEVDIRFGKMGAQRGFGTLAAFTFEGDVASLAPGEPDGRSGLREHGVSGFDVFVVEAVADQGEGVFHHAAREEDVNGPYEAGRDDQEGELSEPLVTKGAILIAGPTASGKSGLALALAERLGGEIVNADSMQVYAELRVLTARPSVEDEARAPHHLYGVLGGDEPCSAGKWSRMALEALRDIEARGRTPIIVGGTGLYFRALTEGLSPIPPVPDEVRAVVRAEVLAAGEGAHDLLAAADPVLAAAIRPSDRQRIARGVEVARGTGKLLSQWHKEPPAPLLTGKLAKIVLAPDREWLRTRSDRRFESMLDEGAVEEARRLATLGLDPALPLMKALGLRPLIDYVSGNIELSEAMGRGQAETRAYAKRQETWLRTQMIAWERYFEQDSERLMDKIFSFIDDLGLTGV